ncbi:MAG: ketosteroid isomerase-like protein [Myxococcota bacterium]|jgi:ketosteroid isomerase-like protein
MDTRAHSPEAQAVLRANEAFYAAFSTMDYDAMRGVWAGRPEDICVHPGWPFLKGWRDIRESWRAIFANTGFMQVTLSELTVEVTGTVGRVSCMENLYSVFDQEAITSLVAATNLFILTADGWRMTLHHGSPVASQPVTAADSDDIN